MCASKILQPVSGRPGGAALQGMSSPSLGCYARDSRMGRAASVDPPPLWEPPQCLFTVPSTSTWLSLESVQRRCRPPGGPRRSSCEESEL